MPRLLLQMNEPVIVEGFVGRDVNLAKLWYLPGGCVFVGCGASRPQPSSADYIRVAWCFITLRFVTRIWVRILVSH